MRRLRAELAATVELIRRYDGLLTPEQQQLYQRVLSYKVLDHLGPYLDMPEMREFCSAKSLEESRQCGPYVGDRRQRIAFLRAMLGVVDTMLLYSELEADCRTTGVDPGNLLYSMFDSGDNARAELEELDPDWRLTARQKARKAADAHRAAHKKQKVKR